MRDNDRIKALNKGMARLSIASVFRVAYAFLLLINVGIWANQAELWFTDKGVLTSETSSKLYGGLYWSLLFEVPSSAKVVRWFLALLALQAFLLLIGIASRFQAACIFFWLITFQHRNPLICDGEDTLFRLFAFFMIWMPLDANWSLASRLRFGNATSGHIGDGCHSEGSDPVVRESYFQRLIDRIRKPTSANWNFGLNLVRIQMTLIYLSAAFSKSVGKSWQDGSAMYYVARMEDYGWRSPIPVEWFDSMFVARLFTWSSLAVEFLLPIFLWVPRTRRLAVVVGILFHLGIEVTLNLFLFQWLMMLGLIAFLERRDRAYEPVKTSDQLSAT